MSACLLCGELYSWGLDMLTMCHQVLAGLFQPNSVYSCAFPGGSPWSDSVSVRSATCEVTLQTKKKGFKPCTCSKTKLSRVRTNLPKTIATSCERKRHPGACSTWTVRRCSTAPEDLHQKTFKLRTGVPYGNKGSDYGNSAACGH
jgi:hypothetical protein